MKILFIHPSVELYGADKILLYILSLVHKDNEVTVLLPKDGILVENIRDISKNINIIIDSTLPIVHSKMGLRSLILLPLSIKKNSKIFKKNEFDFIYCNTLATVGLLFTNWSSKKIIHIHEIIENKILNFGFSVLVKLGAEKVICVSNHVKDNLLFSKKYTVIYNGIPDIAKKTGDEKTAFEKINFVLPGRYMPKKGQWFLINALKEVPFELLKNCNFYLFGSPPPNRVELETELRNLISQTNLSEIVHLFPFTKDISEIYTNADVVLVPSIMADPFPTTVLEAMMFSKAVICTNHGGASEIVKDTMGIQITPNDTKVFAEAIAFFINNRELISQYGKKSRTEYENNFKLENFQNNFISIFNKITF